MLPFVIYHLSFSAAPCRARRSIRVIRAIRVGFFISHRFHRFHGFLFAPLCHLSFIIYHLAQRNARRSIRVIRAIRVSFFISHRFHGFHRFHRFHGFHRFLFAPLCHLSFIIYHLAQRHARRSIRVIRAIRVSFYISHRFHRFHGFLFASPLSFIICHLSFSAAPRRARRSIRVIRAIRVSFFISHGFHRFHRFLFAPLCHLSFIIYHLAQRNVAPPCSLQRLFLQFFVHFVFKYENIEKKPLKICKKCTKPIHLQLKYAIITCQNHKIYVNLAAVILKKLRRGKNSKKGCADRCIPLFLRH